MSTNPLHDARVERGTTLDAIASATRLSPRIVEALDSGRFTDIPAGIYARSYVRAFARAVALDPDVALTALEKLLPTPVELCPAMVEQAQPQARRALPVTILIHDVVVDAAFLFSLSALIVAVVSGYCGVSSTALLHLAPGAVAGLCAPVWVVYEMLLGRLWAHRILWSGGSVLMPSSIGVLSVWAFRPSPAIRRFSSWLNSPSVRAAAASLIRFTRSPGSFLRS